MLFSGCSESQLLNQFKIINNIPDDCLTIFLVAENAFIDSKYCKTTITF